MKPCGFRSLRVGLAHARRAALGRHPAVRHPVHRRAGVGERAGRAARAGDRHDRAHGVLARIVDDAVRDRLLAANPARGVKLPAQVKRQNVYLTADQLHALARERPVRVAGAAAGHRRPALG